SHAPRVENQAFETDSPSGAAQLPHYMIGIRRVSRKCYLTLITSISEGDYTDFFSLLLIAVAAG
ncbi:MAG: hypothetical protein AAB089_06060, partial [Nitrospirota bacterium]